MGIAVLRIMSWRMLRPQEGAAALSSMLDCVPLAHIFHVMCMQKGSQCLTCEGFLLQRIRCASVLLCAGGRGAPSITAWAEVQEQLRRRRAELAGLCGGPLSPASSTPTALPTPGAVPCRLCSHLFPMRQQIPLAEINGGLHK
jgi:hypothetical protein